MSTWIVTALALAASPEATSADSDGVPASAGEAAKGPLRLPPVRIGGHGQVRSTSFPAFGMELGIQPWRTQRTSLGVFARYDGRELVQVPGPEPRLFEAGSLSAETLFHASPLTAIGPSISLAYRSFRQEGFTVGQSLLPQLGATLQACALRNRTWGLAVVMRVAVDLVDTRLSLHTQQVMRLSPLQAQLGLRWLWGHGRVGGVRQ